MNKSQAIIYTAANAQQAHLLKNLLEQQGIQALVTGDALQSGFGDLLFGWSGAPCVVVAQRDAEQAYQVVQQFQRRMADVEQVQDEPGERPRFDWPTCPECSRRRQAVCPICKTAGRDFPLAEFLVEAVELRSTRPSSREQPQHRTADGPPILLICPNCDESFPPRFYRFCEDCGHDFGSGVQLRAEEGPEEMNRRVVLVAAVLGLLAIGSMIYLWILFH